MRQFGLCAYCGAQLSDAMQTDHMDEDRTNDAPENLACACGTCHANKTMHFVRRRKLQLSSMLQTARDNKARWNDTWAEEDDHAAKLPRWLRARIHAMDVQLHHARQKQRLCPEPLPFEQFRYRG